MEKYLKLTYKKLAFCFKFLYICCINLYSQCDFVQITVQKIPKILQYSQKSNQNEKLRFKEESD